MSHLTHDVSEQQHQTLRALAALEGKFLKQYALERLFSADATADQSLNQLKALLLERLNEAQRGEVVTGSISEIAEHRLRTK